MAQSGALILMSRRDHRSLAGARCEQSRCWISEGAYISEWSMTCFPLVSTNNTTQ